MRAHRTFGRHLFTCPQPTVANNNRSVGFPIDQGPPRSAYRSRYICALYQHHHLSGLAALLFDAQLVHSVVDGFCGLHKRLFRVFLMALGVLHHPAQVLAVFGRQLSAVKPQRASAAIPNRVAVNRAFIPQPPFQRPIRPARTC